ncbi:hypothetical protein [Verrucosispora sp. NA02020]|uniref:hypothetical protein n=1 Tax=Verrucosispora sp. NA02020 TaxID=2742132 RepID=UPI003D763683
MTTPTTDDTDRVVPPAAVPVADTAMYHGLLGEIVNAAHPTTEADPAGVLASLLCGTGVAIGPGPFVQIGNTRHPLLIWPLLFGRTGSGRKGEAGETADVFLREGDQHVPGQPFVGGGPAARATGLSSGEGLIERIRDPDPDNEKDTGGTHDKRLFVTEPEFASVMARAKREGSTLGYVLREAWTGKPLTVLNRRSLGTSLSHVGIVGHITPKEFRLRLAEAEMAGGTFNRFLPFYVERSKKLPIPTGADEVLVARLGGRLRDAIAEARRMGALGLDAEATALWSDELYDELSESDDEDAAWTEFARRAAPYCRRIAALYAVLDGRHLVGKADLAASAAVVRYAIETARYVLDGRRRDPRQDRLVRALDAAGDRGMTKTQISALFSRKLSADVLGELLAELTQSGNYELTKVPTGGRPTEVYRRAKKAKEAR